MNFLRNVIGFVSLGCLNLIYAYVNGADWNMFLAILAGSMILLLQVMIVRLLIK